MITLTKEELMERTERIANQLWPNEWELSVRPALDEFMDDSLWFNSINSQLPTLSRLMYALIAANEAGRKDLASLMNSADQKWQETINIHPGLLLIAHYVLCRRVFAKVPKHFVSPPLVDDDLAVFSYLCRVPLPVLGAPRPKDWGYLVAPPSIPIPKVLSRLDGIEHMLYGGIRVKMAPGDPQLTNPAAKLRHWRCQQLELRRNGARNGDFHPIQWLGVNSSVAFVVMSDIAIWPYMSVDGIHKHYSLAGQKVSKLFFF